MISIDFNGETIEVAPNSSLQALLESKLKANNVPFAVVLNNTFIPKQEHATQLLKAKDKVETLTPMQGG